MASYVIPSKTHGKHVVSCPSEVEHIEADGRASKQSWLWTPGTCSADACTGTCHGMPSPRKCQILHEEVIEGRDHASLSMVFWHVVIVHCALACLHVHHWPGLQHSN